MTVRPLRGGCGKAESDGLGPGVGHDHPLHPVEGLDLALDLPGLGQLVAEALDEPLGLGDLPSLDARLALPLGHPGVPLLDEVGVVADVLGQRPVAQLGDAVGDGVDEVAVVADQDDRAGIVGQEPLEPFDRCQVEVVRGLVEQQQVRVGQQQPGEGHAHHPAPGELAHVPIGVAGGEPQAGQDPMGLGLDRPAPELLEPMLQPPVFVHQLGQFGLVGGIGHLLLDVGHAPADAGHRAGPGQHLGHHRVTARLGDFLAEVADDQVLAAGHGARVRALFAGDDLEQRRLAGAVGTDDGHPPAGAHLQADVAEQELGAVALGHAGQVDEAHRRASAVVSRAPASSNRRRVAIPGRPPLPSPFHAFSTAWAVNGESQMARTAGPAPDRQAPTAPHW